MKTRPQLPAIGILTILLLSGCDTKPAESFATSTEPQILMQTLFPGWKKDAATVTQVHWQETDASSTPHETSMWVQVNPALVVPINADRVALIVTGSPSDEKGNDNSSHVSQGNLGAYWFERRSGNWHPAGALPSFTWTGFSGDAGHVSVVQLGAGRQALAIENGSCWQGQCGQWLSLYELGTQSVTPLLEKDESIQLESEDTGATASCSALMEANPGSRHRISQEDYSTAYGCFSVSGKWQIKPGSTQPGDLLIHFTGKQTAAQSVPTATASSTTPEETPADEYLVTVSAVEGTLNYRFSNGRYRHASGENPAPGF